MASELIAITDDLASKLIECQAASVAWLIKAGSILRDYQSQLPRGDMSAIYGSGKLPFGQRYGQMLSAISRNMALCNPALLRFLPASITALVVMASIHPHLIERGIREGIIHRNLTQRSAMDAARKLKTGASEE